MNAQQNLIFSIDGNVLSSARLAVNRAGEGFSNPELLAQGPGGMVYRFHLGEPDFDRMGLVSIPLSRLRPAAEEIYKKIKHENISPSDAAADDVAEKYGDSWPPLDELLKDANLFMDAFDEYFFDMLRLIIKTPNEDTRYIVLAISPACEISEGHLEVRLALVDASLDLSNERSMSG